MDPHLTLREARITRNITIQELSTRTSMSPATVRKIDEGRFDELPPGLYARSYVKSFAREVGLDPVQALQRVEHLLPGAPDPMPVLRELKGPSASDRLGSLAARFLRRANESSPEQVQPPGRQPQHEADSEAPTAMTYHLTRVGAAAVDAGVLLTINAAILLAVSIGTGVAPSVLLQNGALSVGLLCAVPTALYFLIFSGVAGRTPGGRICRLPEPPPHVPLTLEAILRRSLTPTSISYDDSRDLSRPALAGRGH